MQSVFREFRESRKNTLDQQSLVFAFAYFVKVIAKKIVLTEQTGK